MTAASAAAHPFEGGVIGDASEGDIPESLGHQHLVGRDSKDQRSALRVVARRTGWG
ncbi:hypothetical protein N9K72_01640 [Pontimonas sp.]|nr:hypothetical protein [Pontimonas sp.]